MISTDQGVCIWEEGLIFFFFSLSGSYFYYYFLLIETPSSYIKRIYNYLDWDRKMSTK